MTHQSSHIIIQNLKASVATEDESGKCKVWHLIVAAFVAGFILCGLLL